MLCFETIFQPITPGYNMLLTAGLTLTLIKNQPVDGFADTTKHQDGAT